MSQPFSDAQPGIAAPYWTHCGAGMHVGRMDPRPLWGEFDTVLTVASQPGRIDNALRHRHIPVSYINYDVDAVWDAMHYLLTQFEASRTVLVRSEGGLQRPGLVIACAFVHLGASPSEALHTVAKNDPRICSDWRYRHFVRSLFDAMRQP